MSSVISARGLRKAFRSGFWMRSAEAVRGVSFDVAEGEIFGFIGPNGAGKTTTIKMLTGLILPSGGEAWIRGVRVPEPESRRGLGFMPEGTFFHEYLTGREFLDFHGRLLGVPPRARAEQIPQLLARVGLARAAEVRIRRYSKGMRQRVGLAQALIGDPDLLILDEPMSGLDPIGRKDVRELILTLRDEGKTIFFTSHILSDAELLCDQAAVILGGEIAHQGYLEDLLGREIEGVDLAVEGISEAVYEELAREARRAVVQGPRFLFEFCDENQAEKALDRVRSERGRIRSLTPRRRGLEDLLVRGMSRSPGAGERAE
jgi:ABC-2 type transport system ATP-binding protein